MGDVDDALSAAAPDLVAAGGRALTEGAWDRARLTFDTALEEADSPEAFDGLAQALWWLNRPTEAIDARSARTRCFARRATFARAVRVALWLVHEYSAVHGNEPAAEGWLARAEHLLNDWGDIAERGYLELVKAERSLDPAVATGLAEAALERARRLPGADLEFAALSRLGPAELTLGQVDIGLGHLDQAMAAPTGEDAATLETVARTWCSLVLACDVAGDEDRVRHRGRVLDGYVRRRNELPLLTFCPSCEADLLRPAESEARLAHAVTDLAATGQR